MHAPTGRLLSAHSEKNFKAQHRYYEPHYACDITLLICTNYVCPTFLPFVQEYRECDVRRLRDNEVLVFFGKCMSLRNRDIGKTGESLR